MCAGHLPRLCPAWRSSRLPLLVATRNRDRPNLGGLGLAGALRSGARTAAGTGRPDTNPSRRFATASGRRFPAERAGPSGPAAIPERGPHGRCRGVAGRRHSLWHNRRRLVPHDGQAPLVAKPLANARAIPPPPTGAACVPAVHPEHGPVPVAGGSHSSGGAARARVSWLGPPEHCHQCRGKNRWPSAGREPAGSSWAGRTPLLGPPDPGPCRPDVCDGLAREAQPPAHRVEPSVSVWRSRVASQLSALACSAVRPLPAPRAPGPSRSERACAAPSPPAPLPRAPQVGRVLRRAADFLLR